MGSPDIGGQTDPEGFRSPFRAPPNAPHGTGIVAKVHPDSTMDAVCFILRFLAFAFTLIAAALAGPAKLTLSGSFFFTEDVVFKSTDFKELKYFIAVNSIASAYAMTSSALSFAIRGALPKNKHTVLGILDLVILGFLCSAAGCASAATMLTKSVLLDIFVGKLSATVSGNMIEQLKIAIVMCVLGSVMLLALVMQAFVTLRKYIA